MQRIVHHHAYVRRPFDDVCSVLEHDVSGPLAEATLAATRFAAELVPHVSTVDEFFDVDEEVRVHASTLRRHQGTASLGLEWRADPSKRLLPSVSARLDVNPIVPLGPEAITELHLHGDYKASTRRDRRAEQFFLQRRVVDAILHSFLGSLAAVLQAATEPA